MQPPNRQPAATHFDADSGAASRAWQALPTIRVADPGEGAAAWEDRVQLHGDHFSGSWSELETAIRTGDLDPRDLPMAPLAGRVQLALADLEPPPGGPSSEAWLLVALARLSRWKAQQLFPQTPEDAAESEDGGDGDELMRHLLRYERYRELAEALAERAEWESRRFPALLSEKLPWNEADLALDGVDLAALGQALAQVLAASRQHDAGLEVDVEPISVAERLAALRQELAGASGPVPFASLFTPSAGLRHVVVTFLALLELAHQKEIVLRQQEALGPIHVLWRAEPAAGEGS